MRYGNVLLPVLALSALAIGVLAQKPKVPSAFADRLFAKAKPDDFIGEKACAECHSEKVEAFSRSGHAAFVHDPKLALDHQGCEACHGPGKFHLDEEHPENISFKKLSPAESSAACLRCHQDVMTRGTWSHTQHALADVACVSCHQIHPDDAKEPDAKTHAASAVRKAAIFTAAAPPKSLLKSDEATLCGSCHIQQVNQFRQNSHHPVPEGRMVCSDCHEMHNSKQGKKRVSILKDKCATCHGETVGPFVYEHDPVAGWTGDGCAECHKPHGSHNPALLKAFSNGLCAQCHTDKTRNHYTGRTCWTAGCHTAIHGSNTSKDLLRP